MENRASRQGVVRAIAFIPLTMCLDAEMGTRFLEGDLDLPPLDEPSHDLCRISHGVGAEQPLRLEGVLGIADQNPADRYC